jgi:BlaI family penicillinase repressor
MQLADFLAATGFEAPEGTLRTMPDPLSRRERQIMDIVYAHGQATAAEVTAALADAPSYSAVRALLRILEQKGHLRHQQDGPRYVFLPTVSRDRARRSALRSLVRTFFDGSSAQAAAALIDQAQLSDDDFDRLSAAIEKARKEGR